MLYGIILFLTTLAAAAAAWLVFEAYRAGDGQGIALFAFFCLLFAAFPLSALWRTVLRRTPPDGADVPGPGTTFVPHWWLMTAIGITVAGILLIVLLSLLR